MGLDVAILGHGGGGSGALPSNVAYKDSNNNFTVAQLFPAGTAGAPGVQIAAGTQGIYQIAAGTIGISTASAERVRIGSFGLTVTGNLQASGSMLGGIVAIGSVLNLPSTGSAGILEITQANFTINLPQKTYGASVASAHRITDPQLLLATGTIHPWDDGLSQFNAINEGRGAEGAWFDPASITNGPAGNDAIITTTGAEYIMTTTKTDPGVAFATGGASAAGGWLIQKESTVGYT